MGGQCHRLRGVPNYDKWASMMHAHTRDLLDMPLVGSLENPAPPLALFFDEIRGYSHFTMLSTGKITIQWTTHQVLAMRIH